MSCWAGVFTAVFFVRSLAFLEVAMGAEDVRALPLEVLSVGGALCDGRPLDVGVPDTDAVEADILRNPGVPDTSDVLEVSPDDS